MSFSGKERWPSLIMALLLAFVMGLPATGWAQQPAEGEGEAAGAEGAPQARTQSYSAPWGGGF